MHRTVACYLAIALVLGGAGCADRTGTGPTLNTALLDGAFATTPLGYNYVVSSFDGSAGAFAWAPRADHFGGGLMGGGLGRGFLGEGFDFGWGHGRFGDDHLDNASCTFDAATGRVECAPVTFGGLTITRSISFANAAGQVQSAFDSTTNTIDTRVSVTGTVTHTRRDSAVSTVSSASERTVSGLAPGSTRRTINGTSAGMEKTVGADSTGHFTATRITGDTTMNVVVPAPGATSPRPYPTGGTIIRSMQATLQYDGKAPASASRREVVTYDGSSTAKVVITENGQTKNCTLPLPRGRLTCP